MRGCTTTRLVGRNTHSRWGFDVDVVDVGVVVGVVGDGVGPGT